MALRLLRVNSAQALDRVGQVPGGDGEGVWLSLVVPLDGLGAVRLHWLPRAMKVALVVKKVTLSVAHAAHRVVERRVIGAGVQTKRQHVFSIEFRGARIPVGDKVVQLPAVACGVHLPQGRVDFLVAQVIHHFAIMPPLLAGARRAVEHVLKALEVNLRAMKPPLLLDCFHAPRHPGKKLFLTALNAAQYSGQLHALAMVLHPEGCAAKLLHQEDYKQHNPAEDIGCKHTGHQQRVEVKLLLVLARDADLLYKVTDLEDEAQHEEAPERYGRRAVWAVRASRDMSTPMNSRESEPGPKKTRANPASSNFLVDSTNSHAYELRSYGVCRNASARSMRLCSPSTARRERMSSKRKSSGMATAWIAMKRVASAAMRDCSFVPHSMV
eukprot:1594274-Prymnesium_polylepis.2